MKKSIYLLLFFIIICNTVTSQNHLISEYEKYDYDKENAKYYDLLNENVNSLLLKVDDNKFIIYNSDKEIYKVRIGYLSGKVIEKEKQNEEKSKSFKTVLDLLNKINPNLLNETKNSTSNGDVTIEDGSLYNLLLIKNNYYVNYSTYAPYEHIENKSSFYEERIRFLDVLKKANELFLD